jgi:hypothetical protein
LYQGAASAAPQKPKKRRGFNPCPLLFAPQLSAFRFNKRCLGPVRLFLCEVAFFRNPFSR